MTEYLRQIKVLEYENKDLKKFVRLLKACIIEEDLKKIVEENERLRHLIKEHVPENCRDEFNEACNKF